MFYTKRESYFLEFLMDNFPSKLDLCITLSDDLKLLSDIWQIADLCRAFSNKFLAEL